MVFTSRLLLMFFSADYCPFQAWVLGAADPTSGTVSLHEIIRAFGALVRQGWKPLRNIVIASWDAEEVRLPLPGIGACLLIRVIVRSRWLHRVG